MKLVKVLIPFNDKVTGKPYEVNDEIELTDERIAEVRTVNANMVLVLGDAKKPKAEATEPKPKKPRTKKQ